MKRNLFFTLTLLLLICSSNAFSQYYFRGQLKDEQGNGLQGVRIALFSKGNYPYFTGNEGVFGIPSSLKVDTVTFMMEGYDTLRLPVATSQYGSFVLKALRKKTNASLHLASYTPSYPYINLVNEQDELNHSSLLENPFMETNTYGSTAIGMGIDKSGYSLIRQNLNDRQELSSDEVRVEEVFNYFNLKTVEAAPGKAFTFNSQFTSCPWNEQNRLLFINIIATKINLDKTPVANIVFLIDASGSMDLPNRLPLIKSAFKLLTENMRPTDKVTIITYGDVVTQLLPATPGSEKQKIIETIEGLRPNGTTPGASAIQMAYEKAHENFVTGGNNRIIMATDGDFNVGATNFKGLEELAERESKAGVHMSCIGVGMTKDENLEALARAGQGHFAYLDNEIDAEKMLVEEFAQTLYAVAGNVQLNVQFNNSEVSAHRLIGFDNKKSAINQQVTDLYGGEVGSGQSLMAAFEITPTTSTSAPLANIQLSYELPNQPNRITENYEAPQNFLPLTQAGKTYQFAAAVLAFGEMLKQSAYLKDFNWSDLETLTQSALTPGDLLQKEMADLVTQARKIYPAHRRNKLADSR